MKHEIFKENNKSIIDYKRTPNKKREVLNNVLNIAICGTACYFSGFNPIVIAASFISWDILSVSLNKLAVRRNVNKIKKIDNYGNMKLQITNDYTYEEYYDYEYNLLKKLKDEAKEKQKKLEEETKFNKKELKQNEVLDDCFSKLLNFDYDHVNINNKKYENIIKKTKKLQKLIGENKEYYIYLDTTFKTYVDELMMLLSAFKSLGCDIEGEKLQQCEDLLDTFIKYLDKTINKITTHNKVLIDTTYEVLKKNLEKE